VDIWGSARKHGIADEDMLHAVRVSVVQASQDARRVLHIGADTAGRMLEVVVVDGSTVIHADRLRPKFYAFLEGEVEGR
jgi:pyruvate carboxylase